MLDLPRQLHNGARAGRKIHARVRGEAVDGNRVISHALACRLELALQSSSRFQHQHCFGATRRFLRERARRIAAHLFIGIDQHFHAAANRKVEFPQRPHSEDEERQARLHVEYTRTPQSPLRFTERHLDQHARRPDRVGMPQGQNLAFPLRWPRQREFTQQVPAELSSWKCLQRSQRLDFRGYQINEPIHRARIIARRLALYHPPD